MARVASARSNMLSRTGSVTPAARQAALAVGWSARVRTTVTRSGCLRKDSRLVLNEYMPFVTPLVFATLINVMSWAIGLEVTLAILGLVNLDIPTLGTMILGLIAGDWIDSEGRSFGILVMRFLQPEQEPDLPSTRVVRLADLTDGS